MPDRIEFEELCLSTWMGFLIFPILGLNIAELKLEPSIMMLPDALGWLLVLL